MRWGEVMDVGEGPVVVNNNQHEDHDETGSNNDNNEHEDDNNSDENSHTSHDIENNVPQQQEEQQQPQAQSLRRMTHQIIQPSYLDDYVLQAAVECEKLLLSIDDEPRCYKEAKGLLNWRQASKKESIQSTKTRLGF